MTVDVEEHSDTVYVRRSGVPTVLALHRETLRATVVSANSVPALASGKRPQQFAALVGCLVSGTAAYLLFVDRATRVGSMHGSNDVYHVDSVTALRWSTAGGARNLRRAVSLAKSLLSSGHVYFGEHEDLCVSMQERAAHGKNAVDDFVFNAQLLGGLRSELSEPFLTKIIMGFVQHAALKVHDTAVEYWLVSRRSRHRAGTRLNRRGIDPQGNVANMVETEQIVFAGEHVFSHVQVRGSIPLLWTQRPNLRYKPRLKQHSSPSANADAYASHRNKLLRMYHRVTYVNLVDQKGSEGLLERSFAEMTKKESHDAVKYVAFDFHKECSRMRYERLSLLMDQLTPDLKVFGQYHLHKGKEVSKQSGVTRTNCIDCLDRTNVVQSLVGRFALAEALASIGVVRHEQDLQSYAEVTTTLRHLWADHADAISVQYSGTPALKTDFTRTGKRTKKGALSDLWNSIKRYFLNNLTDGHRQDQFDVVSGVALVGNTDLREHRAAIRMLLLLVVMIVLAVVSSRTAVGTNVHTLAWIGASVALFVLVFMAVVRFLGPALVDKPSAHAHI